MTSAGSFHPNLQLLPPLREWETRLFPGVQLTPEGRAQADKLLGRGRNPTLELTELREGLQVNARSWVGVVRLDSVEIRIAPKLTGDHLDLLRLLERVGGIDGLTRLAGDVTIELAGDSLLDLVALLFAESCQRLLRRRGLLAGYVEREEALPVARGRILADRQIRERFGRLDRIVCRFDDLAHDIDENRILAIALRGAQRLVRSAAVRQKIARLRSVFELLCDTNQIDVQIARRQLTYHRLNAHYKQPHDLAWLLLDGLGADDILAPGATRSFAFLLDMNLLFERFVEHLVRAAVGTSCHVRSQAAQTSIIWNATTERHYSRITPDLLIRTRTPTPSTLAIDAKYKLYDQRRLDPADIYQTFLYAYALTRRPGGAPPTSLILYPASADRSAPLNLRIRPLHARAPAEILTLALPIPAAVAELAQGSGPTIDFLRSVLQELLTESPQKPSELNTLALP